MRTARARRVALYSVLGLVLAGAVGFVLLGSRAAYTNVAANAGNASQWSEQLGAGRVFPACASSVAPCTATPSNPTVGQTVTWNESSADVAQFQLGGPNPYVQEAWYLGTSPNVMGMNLNASCGAFTGISCPVSAQQTYSSPGWQYAELQIYYSDSDAAYCGLETCNPVYGSATEDCSVYVSPASPPTASLTVNGVHNLTVNPGDAYSFAWNSTNGTSFSSVYSTNSVACAQAAGATGNQTTNIPWIADTANGSAGPYTAPTSQAGCTYTVTYEVSGPGGHAFDNIAVIHALPPPTASLTASPSTIDSGQSSTLSWSSTNATSCTGTGFSTGGKTSGTASTGALTQTSTYQVTCFNSVGTSAPASATVTVLQPNVTISASPQRVPSGGSITVSWNATNVNSCSITKNGSPWKNNLKADANRIVSGSTTDAITNQTTYGIVCSNNSSATAATASQIVNVTQVFQEF